MHWKIISIFSSPPCNILYLLLNYNIIVAHNFFQVQFFSRFNRVNEGPHHLDSTISFDHLYQPSDYNTKAGYKVVSNAYEHGNATFSAIGSGNESSFNIAPDWESERKKSVVIRH